MWPLRHPPIQLDRQDARPEVVCNERDDRRGLCRRRGGRDFGRRRKSRIFWPGSFGRYHNSRSLAQPGQVNVYIRSNTISSSGWSWGCHHTYHPDSFSDFSTTYRYHRCSWGSGIYL